MKEWMKRWLGIGKPSEREVMADVVGQAFAKLEAAQNAHISDLRVLIDKAHDREAALSSMVQLALEHQFYRPTVTGKAGGNKVTPLIAPEQLQDVAVFDEQADIEQQRAHDERTAQLESLIAEQNESGLHKVEA